MDGPYNGGKSEKKNKKFVANGMIRVTPINDDSVQNDAIEIDEDNVGGNEKEEEVEDDERAVISLNADSFVYNELTKSYTVNLSGCKLIRSDVNEQVLSFEIREDYVVKNQFDVDGKYIDKVLDEIQRDNPDTEEE